MISYKETEKMAVHLVEAYYKGDMSMFYTTLHPRAVMMSIGKGHIVVGKENIEKEFVSRESEIHYDIVAMSCKVYPIKDDLCYTIQDMDIVSTYQSSDLERVNQRISIIWQYIRAGECEKEGVLKEGWYTRHGHISIGQESKKEPVNITHFSEVYLQDYIAYANQEKKILFREVGGKMNRVAESQIMWIQGIKNGSIVQLQNDRFEIRKYLKDIENDFSGQFLRIGKSYIVNVSYVTMIKNAKVILQDGSELSVSKKNYAQIRDKIKAIMEQNHL